MKIGVDETSLKRLMDAMRLYDQGLLSHEGFTHLYGDARAELDQSPEMVAARYAGWSMQKATGPTCAYWVDSPQGVRTTFPTQAAAYEWMTQRGGVILYERARAAGIVGVVEDQVKPVVTVTTPRAGRFNPYYEVWPHRLWGWNGRLVYGKTGALIIEWWRPAKRYAEWKGSKELLRHVESMHRERITWVPKTS